MRSTRRGILIVLLLMLVTACSGDAAPSQPGPTLTPTATPEPVDPTAHVVERDLRGMVLGQQDYGAIAAGFSIIPGASGAVDNAEATGSFVALDITPAEVAARGRLAGYELTFIDVEDTVGPFAVLSSVELFTTTASASAYLDLYAEDSRATPGVNDDGVLFLAAPEFALPGVGDPSGGVRHEARFEESGEPFTFTIGYFQYGRLIGVVNLGAFDGVDRSRELTELTVLLGERVRGVVEGDGAAQSPGSEGPFDPSRDAAADIEAALALASADGRRVLIDFGANWCPDCIVLDQLLTQPQVRGVVDAGFHLVRVDAGFFDRNLDIAERYMPRLEGISTLVVLDDDGTVLTVAPEFADARVMTADDVLSFLGAWAPAAVAAR